MAGLTKKQLALLEAEAELGASRDVLAAPNASFEKAPERGTSRVSVGLGKAKTVGVGKAAPVAAKAPSRVAAKVTAPTIRARDEDPAPVAPKAGAVVRRTVGSGKGAAPAVPQGGRITAWSFSRFKDWLECPLKAKFKHVLRMREPDSPAMARGSALHKIAEDFAAKRFDESEFKKQVAAFEIQYKKPTKLLEFMDEFRAVRKLNPIVEESWGFNAQWEECGWFGSDTWLRVKLDLAALQRDGVLRVVDHKSGKPADDHVDQLSLYAATGLIKFPQVKKVSTEIWYADSGDLTEQEFTRDQFTELTSEWDRKVAPMMNDTAFKAKPNSKCQWCFFRKGNGGPCQW